MRVWADESKDGSICFRLAEPDDPYIDEFDSGDSPEAKEVTAYFQSRQWFNPFKRVSQPPVYQFGWDDKVIAYAALGFRNCGHPTESSPSKARYLVIYVIGLHKTYQNKLNPNVSRQENYSETVFRVLCEHFARQKSGCQGLYLHVRETNKRAIAFYKRIGFKEDIGGPIQRGEGAKHLVMRLPFEAPTS